MIKRNGRHLSLISSVIAKGLNTYANVIFQFFLFNRLAKMSKILFLLCHCGVLSAVQHKKSEKSEWIYFLNATYANH